MGTLRAEKILFYTEKYASTNRKVSHAFVDSDKRIVKFNSNIREAGVFEGWLVGHVHHVKVILKRDSVLKAE